MSDLVEHLRQRELALRSLARTTKTVRHDIALTAAAAKEIEDLRKRLLRYEDWRLMSEPTGRPNRYHELFHFFMPGTDDENDPDTWQTATWADRPANATHWCLIVSPLGPYETRS